MSIDVLDVAYAAGSLRDGVHAAVRRARSGEGGYCAFCNVHLLTTARRKPAVMDALDGAWSVFPDGAPIAWLQQLQGFRGAERMGGPDFMLDAMDIGREVDLRHTLFGSTPDVVDALEKQLERRFPGVQFVDVYAPPTGAERTSECLDRLAAARPDMIWCALGAPKQELWMQYASPLLGSPLLLGVGAAFDFHSGGKQRAPLWMRNAGVEWLHRLVSEPRRLSRRYVVTNAQFTLDAGRWLVAKHRTPKDSGR